MAGAILAEAILRVEHKLDILLRALVPFSTMHQMIFQGSPCPVCLLPIDYQIDLQNNVVVRRCGCSTGKSPSVIPLFPASQEGTQNGSRTPGAAGPTSTPGSSDGG